MKVRCKKRGVNMNTLKITVGEVVKEYAEGASFETIARLIETMFRSVFLKSLLEDNAEVHSPLLGLNDVVG